jgi:gamma-glutamyltranspeptidase/glutathione hydrolase
MPLNALMDDNYLKQRMANFSFKGNLIFRYQRRKRNVQRKYGNDPLDCRSVGNAAQQRLLMRVMVLSITVMTFLLNNEMDDFSAKAEYPICLNGNEANSIAPQRMLSSMTPTIVERRTESFYDRWFPWRFDDYYSVLQTILNV